MNDKLFNSQTLMEMLYCTYTNNNAIDSEKIRKGFEEIERLTQGLAFQESDAVCSAVVSICAEQEQIAFLAGLRVGAQLVLELTET